MYVSVPKNYSGIAFGHSSREETPEACEKCEELPHLPEPSNNEERCENEHTHPKQCEKCENEKNPLSSLLGALRGRGKSGFDNEDFLLIGLIALLVGREGNEDILLILAMLLLI